MREPRIRGSNTMSYVPASPPTGSFASAAIFPALWPAFSGSNWLIRVAPPTPRPPRPPLRAPGGPPGDRGCDEVGAVHEVDDPLVDREAIVLERALCEAGIVGVLPRRPRDLHKVLPGRVAL